MASLLRRSGWGSAWLLVLLALVPAGCSKSPSESPAAPKSADKSTTQSASVAPTPAPNIPPGAMVIDDITPGKKGGRIVIGIAGDPKTFNPLTDEDASSSQVVNFLFDALYGYDPFTQKDEPGAAEKWEYDAEKLQWTFRLREGMKWSDGAPLTSDDFLFYAESVFDERIPTPLKEFFQTDGKRFEFSAPDPLTFVAKIPGVDSFAILNLGLVKALPRHKYAQAVKDGKFATMLASNTPPEELVSSGPFRLKEYKTGEKIVLEANPFYYAFDKAGTRLPYVDQLVLLIVPDFNAMSLRFQAGDLDLLEDIQMHDLTILKDGQEKGNYSVVSPGVTLNRNHYWFNLKEGGSYDGPDGKRLHWTPDSSGQAPPADITAKNYRPYVDPVKLKWFNNIEFRKACSMATNRDAIVKTILFGEGEAIYGYENPGNKEWYNPDTASFPYDLTKAAAILDAAGFKERDENGIRKDSEGHPVRFNLISNKENNVREKVGVLLKEDLRRIGLDVTLQLLDFSDLVTRTSDTFAYEACLLGVASGVPPHPAMGANSILSAGRLHEWNPGQKKPATPWEAKVDELYGSLKKTFDAGEQKKIYGEIQRIFCEQVVQIPTANQRLFVASSNKIGNVKPSILRPYLTHNLSELYLK